MRPVSTWNCCIVLFCLICLSCKDKSGSTGSSPAVDPDQFQGIIRNSRFACTDSQRIELKLSGPLCPSPGGCGRGAIDFALITPEGDVLLRTGPNTVRRITAVRERRFAALEVPAQIAAIGAGPRETVAILDLPSHSVLELDRSARIIGRRVVVMDPNTREVMFAGTRPVGLVVPEAERETDQVQGKFLLLDTAGSQSRALATRALNPEVIKRTGFAVTRGFFPAHPSWAVARNLTVTFSPGDKFQIEQYDSSGKARKLITCDVPPVPVTQAELAEKVAQLRNSARLAPRSLVSSLHNNIDLMASRTGANHPPLTAIVETNDGMIWARGASEKGANKVSWTAFNPDGTVLGTTLLSTTSRIVGDTGRELLVIERLAGGFDVANWYRKEIQR